MTPLKKAPRTAPNIDVSESGAEAPEALSRGDVDRATEIITERLARGVFESSARPVLLKDPSLQCRWFNEEVNPDHLWRAITKQGWVPVTINMVDDRDMLGGLSTNPSGHVVRGQRDQEHLLYMTAENYARIMAGKEANNNRLLGSTRKTKTTIAERAATELGPEAADWVDRHVIGDVVDSTERIDRLPEHDEHG